MGQIRRVAEAGADIVRVAVPRDQDVEALGTIVRESPIPVIADIHFNYTLALKALDAGAHCVRLNPGNIGGPDKVAKVDSPATELGTPLRVGVNSGSLPAHLRQLEYDDPVEALVSAAVEFVELMERLDFRNFKVSMKSTSVPNTIAANRLLSERIRTHSISGDRGGDEMVGIAEVGRRPGHAAGRRDRRHDPDLALDVPRRGGGQGGVGDPQGVEAPRARSGADRLPDVRPPPVRHGQRRRRGRTPAGGLRGSDRGVRARLRRQRDRRGPPRRLRDHRREGHGNDLFAGRAAEEGADRTARRELFAEIDRYYAAGRTSSATRHAPPRPASGCQRTRTPPR